MNTYDSQVAVGILEKEGFEVIPEPETGEDSDGNPMLSEGADVVLMNTCSVRQHAEERVWGRLGMLGKEKQANPHLIIGLMGCMVEEHREKIFKRFPQLDLMVGTRNIKELPRLIREVQETRRQVARIKRDGISIEYSEFTKRDSPYHAWLPIMTGCNKVCTFCVVPMTRGSEVSMSAEDVCREARRLVADGVKWLTLLGQNVNSYSGHAPRTTHHESWPVARGSWSEPFPSLLEMLCQIDGLERISFTTSHPSDATEDLFRVIARNPKISRRFHLPLQSGSDKILKRMKRLHTYAEYKAKVDRLRELVSDISITTDIIVGFPGETEDDYQATKRALEELRFDGGYIYKYSVRPGTPASKLPDDVPFERKSQRNNELLAIQRVIMGEKNKALVGRTIAVFVEGPHPENQGEWFGRMDQDKRVIFPCEEDLSGKFVKLELVELHNETFRGRLV